MKEKVAAISVLANMFLAGSKITVGFFSNSAVIFADGIHSCMDILSSAISYIGIRISQKPEDKKHPYGHYKFEVLGGLMITVILLVTGIGIIYEAYQKFFNIEKIKITYLAFGVMIFSAVVNEIMARIKLHFGKKENSISLLSDGFHSRIDVYASLAIFVGLFLVKYWSYADSLLAFLIGLYIIKESFSIGSEALDPLLDVSAGEEIDNKIKSISKIQNIEIFSLKTQKKGSAVTASFEIQLPSNLSIEEATKISNMLKDNLIKEIENLQYITIQIISHELETCFYKSLNLGKKFTWQRHCRFKGDIQEAIGKEPDGYGVCSGCSYKIPNQIGNLCSIQKCPNCNINLKT
ncbi:MAG: cation transporter [Desulfobacterales bacterium]|nr:cation transporter [Desulfobacterales bacterium]